MAENNEFTTRVKMGPDGIYRWKSPTKFEPDKEAYRMVLIVCVVVTVLCIGICAIISWDYVFTMAPIAVGSVGAAILLFLLVVKLNDRIMQKYELSDAYVKIGDKKVPYNEIDTIVVNPLYLELHAKGKSTRIYAPNEDFLFVKDYIVNHTLGHAAVTYDRYGTTSTGEE